MQKKYLKLIITAALFVYCLYYFHGSQTDPVGSWHFIDNVDLVIHEAGHVVFSFFGDFMHILGGSLFQILVPLIFAGYFVYRKQYFSASLLLYWAGINFINVSVYAGDAVRMQLPLITGNSEDHDWNQLLFRLGWLHYTATVSRVILFGGMVSIFSALIWGAYSALRLGEVQDENDRIQG